MARATRSLRKWLIAVVLASTASLTFAAPAKRDTTAAAYDSATWKRLDVDGYISFVLNDPEGGVGRSTFLLDYPMYINNFDLVCDLDDPCLTEPSLDGLSDDEVRQNLVVAALGHLNDVAIAINQLYKPESSYYKHIWNITQATWYAFASDGLAKDVPLPADDFANIFWNPIHFIPNLYPNKQFANLVADVIKTTSSSAFGYDWLDFGQDNCNGQQCYPASMAKAGSIWEDAYNNIIQGAEDVGAVDIVNLISGGTILDVPDLDQLNALDWREQAGAMYSRNWMMALMKYMTVFLHRGDYKSIPCQTTTFNMSGAHCDGYLYKSYYPVHWAKTINATDNSTSATRDYTPADYFGMPGSPFDMSPAVVYSKSWDCFSSQNSHILSATEKTLYTNSWTLWDADQPLYIQNWNAQADSFDMAMPNCVYNLPVNDLPNRVFDSPFTSQIKDVCGQSSEYLLLLKNFDDDLTPSADEYFDYVQATDAISAVIISSSTMTKKLQTKALNSFCQAANDEGKSIDKAEWNEFQIGTTIGLVLHWAPEGFGKLSRWASGKFTKAGDVVGKVPWNSADAPSVFEGKEGAPEVNPQVVAALSDVPGVDTGAINLDSPEVKDLVPEGESVTHNKIGLDQDGSVPGPKDLEGAVPAASDGSGSGAADSAPGAGDQSGSSGGGKQDFSTLQAQLLKKLHGASE